MSRVCIFLVRKSVCLTALYQSLYQNFPGLRSVATQIPDPPRLPRTSRCLGRVYPHEPVEERQLSRLNRVV